MLSGAIEPTASYCHGGACLSGKPAHEVEERVERIEATNPPMGQPVRSLPGAEELPGDGRCRVRVATVIGRDADGLLEGGGDQRRVEPDGQGLLPDPALA